jgi:AcrR family transcriptional regulator
MPTKVYQNHRDRQRERILEVAEKLFIRDGIDGVTLNDIADEARLSRVTLYTYFTDKEEIAWAVFQSVVEQIREVNVDRTIDPDESGYQRIERFVWRLMRNNLEIHLAHSRFIALFNYMYARENSGRRMRSTILSAWPEKYELLSEWIREGIADGSIQSDLDADLATAAISNLIAGMTHRFALLEANIEEEYGYSVSALYEETFRNFLRGIRAG